ncbi:hypothetical protein D3C81_1901440 [compost metagenome]
MIGIPANPHFHCNRLAYSSYDRRYHFMYFVRVQQPACPSVTFRNLWYWTTHVNIDNVSIRLLIYYLSGFDQRLSVTTEYLQA